MTTRTPDVVLRSFLGAATLGQCHSPLSVGQTIVAKTGFPTSDWNNSTAVVISTGVSVVGVHVNGFVFHDGAVSTAPASASASTTQAVSTPTSNSVRASNTASALSSPSGGIGSGEKIGIGVGVSVGFLGICCLIIAFILVKRRSGPRNPVLPANIVEAPSYPPNYPLSRRAIGSNSIYEAPGQPGDGRTMAGKYQQWPAETDPMPGGSKQYSTPAAEMWVPPSHGG